MPGADAGFWRGGGGGGGGPTCIIDEGEGRAKNFVVRIPIFPQIVHVRGPGIGN